MDYLVTGGIVIFVVIVVFILWKTTQNVYGIIIPTEMYLLDVIEVSYVFLPTDLEFGSVKGWSYKRNETITTKTLYKGTTIKFGDIVTYRYKENQINEVELV